MTRSHTVHSKHLFYQLVFRKFGKWEPIELSPPLPVEELIDAALDSPVAGFKEELFGDRAALVKVISPTLHYCTIYFLNILA